MIEALVDHFQKHGYSVDVRPGVLRIYKVVGQEIMSVYWMIAPIELKQAHSDCLFWIADTYINQLKEAERAKVSD